MVIYMSNLKQQLKNLDVSKLKLVNGGTIAKELQRHAAILADCIMLELDKVYDSYEPKVYQRTYGLYNSLIIGNLKLDISTSGTSLSINLTFDRGAFHKSLDGKEVNVAILLNEGWHYDSWRDIPMFTHREPTYFMQRGIERYKKSVSNPFKIRLTINEKEEIY